MKKLSLLIITIFLLVQNIYGQEWAQSKSFDTLVLDESITALYQLHVMGERVFAATTRADFTNGLYYSDDSGATWMEATSDNSTGAYTVFANVDSDTIYNYGNDLFGNRTLRKSIDKGSSWLVQNVEYAGFPLFFIPSHFSAINDTLIITSATRDVGLLKSTDGGNTWNDFIEFSDNDNNKSINGLENYGNYFFISIGTNGRGLFRSHKDSTSWEKVYAIDAISDSNYGFTMDSNGTLYIMRDGGIAYSEDLGESWTLKTQEELGIPISGVPTGIELNGEYLIITIAGADNGPQVIRLNKDLNSVAENITSGLTDYEQGTRILNLKANSTSAFAIRNGIFDKLWIFGNDEMSVSNEAEENLSGFKLFQNYPNPFNPATNISFYIPKSGKANLLVYNMLGKRVANLVSGRLNAGDHMVTFDASQLPSGMYIYRLEVGSISQTRKMLLIK